MDHNGHSRHTPRCAKDVTEKDSAKYQFSSPADSYIPFINDMPQKRKEVSDLQRSSRSSKLFKSSRSSKDMDNIPLFTKYNRPPSKNAYHSHRYFEIGKSEDNWKRKNETASTQSSGEKYLSVIPVKQSGFPEKNLSAGHHSKDREARSDWGSLSYSSEKHFNLTKIRDTPLNDKGKLLSQKALPSRKSAVQAIVHHKNINHVQTGLKRKVHAHGISSQNGRSGMTDFNHLPMFQHETSFRQEQNKLTKIPCFPRSLVQKKFNLPEVCCNPDFNSTCWWTSAQLSYVDRKKGNNVLSYFISNMEPLITFVETRQSRNFPHYHISRPLYSNPSQLGREWLPIQLPPVVQNVSNGFDFTVLSYNVLSDDLLWENKRLYNGCPEWLLNWEYRNLNLLNEIVNYNADILCLQEIQANHFREIFIPRLQKEGYLGVYKQRTGRRPDGCAIFFRESRFAYKQSRLIEYFIPGHPVMNRDNVGMVLALQPLEEAGVSKKPTIFVANTHLLFNKKRGDVKLLQLAKLFSEIDQMTKIESQATTTDDCYNPVVICGDFNSKPFSPLYDFMVNGKLKYQGLSRVHVSGQISSDKTRNTADTLFRSRLIPAEMNISHLCQKMGNAVGKTTTRPDALRATGENENHLDNDCFIVEERISEKTSRICQKNHKNAGKTTMSGRAIRNNESELDHDCFVVGEKILGRKIVLEEPGVLKHLLHLQSAYKHVPENLSSEVTTCYGTVDYILFSQGKKRCISQTVFDDDDVLVELPRKQLYLIGTLRLLSEETINRLPNAYLSSDHLALLATFRLLE